LERQLSGQGVSIKHIAEKLKGANWNVVYVCVPNTPHVGVVPISTGAGVTAQRYPDILSTKDDVIRLTEVEISLNENVAMKAIERFLEQRSTLLKPIYYTDFGSRVKELTGIILPQKPIIICELITCKNISIKANVFCQLLLANNINVMNEHEYIP